MNLHPFQSRAADKLAARRRAYLRFPMRSGKTIIAATAAMRALATRKVIVICPPIAKEVWRSHWSKWSIGTPDIYGDNEIDRDIMHRILDQRPSLVIIDEAHRHKNMTAARSRNVMTLANWSDRVWFLSATPCPNNHAEMYTPLRAVWPDELRGLGITDHQSFLDTFCVTRTGRLGKTVVVPDRVQNAAIYRELLERVMIVPDRLWEIELPDLRWVVEPLAIDPAIRAAMEQDMVALLPEIKADVADGEPHNVFGIDAIHPSRMSTLRRVFGIAKARQAGSQIAAELADRAYEKVVVMAYHREVMDHLHDALLNFGVMRVDGEVGQAQRQEAINIFQTVPGTRVFLAQITTAGVAIDLSAADTVILVESTWVPEDDRQAAARILKIGKERACLARVLVVPDSLDETIQRSQARKLRGLGETVYFYDGRTE